MSDLKGKNAIVTGCANRSGIGRAIALKLASEGAAVAVADVCKEKSESDKNWDGLSALVSEIEAAGGKATAVSADITDEKEVASMVLESAERLGGIDILVNNAGAVFGLNLSYMMSPADWRKMLEVNLTGAFLVSRAVALAMVKRGKGGAIVNIASWRGRKPAPFMAGYCAAKAGVISLTEVMALELAANRIRVNAVCPGKVETDMESMGWNLKADASGKTMEDIKKEEEQKIPLGRIALPADIANLVAFLASADSDYMTGQTIYITGGMTLVNVR